MEEVEVKMEWEKTTMNTYRYKEIPAPATAPILKTIYVQKFLFGDTAPKKLSVILHY